jgi:signal peptidase I
VVKRLLLPLGLLATAVAALGAPLIKRYVVEGRSMLRAYAPGDHLLVERLSYRFREPRAGDAVVVRQPSADGRLDLKRIVAAPGSSVTVRGERVVLGYHEWYVLGDNLEESTDSRHLGPVKRADIVGRVWLKY